MRYATTRTLAAALGAALLFVPSLRAEPDRSGPLLLAQARGPICMPRAALAAQLGQGYGESVRAMGLVNGRAIMETWASDKGSWSVVLTRANGLACIIAAGDGWEAVKPVPAGNPL